MGATQADCASDCSGFSGAAAGRDAVVFGLAASFDEANGSDEAAGSDEASGTDKAAGFDETNVSGTAGGLGKATAWVEVAN